MHAIKYVGYLWLLPRTIVGVLIMLVFYRAHSWRWSEGCIECIAGEKLVDALDRDGNLIFDPKTGVPKKEFRTRIWGKPGAQTWGFAIVYSSAAQRDRKDLRVHERVHVWQAIIWLEIGFGLGYGGTFVWHLIIDGERWVINRTGYVRRPTVIHGDIVTTIPLHEDEKKRWRRAYLRICFERQAYRIQDEFLQGEHAGAWGSLAA